MMNYGARKEGASAVCNITLVLLLSLRYITSTHDLIWIPPFQLSHCSSFSNMSFFPSQKNAVANAAQQPCFFLFFFDSAWKEIALVFIELSSPSNMSSWGPVSAVTLIPRWLLAVDWVACWSHYSYLKWAQSGPAAPFPVSRIEERGSENRAQISVHIQHPHSLLDSVPAVFHWRRHTLPPAPLFASCSSVGQPPVVWEVGFPGGMAQVAVMSLQRSASRTICPSFCPHFIYVMAHLVNTMLPATHLLITTCWHSFNLFL